MSQTVSWSLPPGWQMQISKSKGIPYYFQTANPQTTQWEPPVWDSIVAESYATSKTSRGSEDFRSLQNWIKSSILFCCLWSYPVHKVLDLACGKGGDVGKIPAEIEYVGIDICKESLAAACQRHPRRQFFQASFNTDSLSSIVGNDFSGAMCMFALHYAENLVKTLQNIRNCLLPGSPLVFTTLDQEECFKTPQGRGPIRIEKWETDNSRNRVWVQVEGTIQTPLPEYLLSEQHIQNAAEKAGFSVVLHQGFGLFMKSRGIGESLVDPLDVQKVHTRNVLLHIRNTFYAKHIQNWSLETWYFANLYKVVVLVAKDKS